MTYNLFRRNNDVDEMEDVINHFFNDYGMKNSHNMLRSDIKETEQDYILDVEAPGVEKKDIKLSYDQGYLNIEASIVENEEEKKNVHFLRKERHVGTFARSFYIGEIEQKNIQASFNNGILTITIPKKSKEEQEKNKYIEIA